MATRKKTSTGATRSHPRNWRRDMLAREIYVALVVRKINAPPSADNDNLPLFARLADQALQAAGVFENGRKGRR